MEVRSFLFLHCSAVNGWRSGAAGWCEVGVLSRRGPGRKGNQRRKVGLFGGRKSWAGAPAEAASLMVRPRPARRYCPRNTLMIAASVSQPVRWSGLSARSETMSATGLRGKLRLHRWFGGRRCRLRWSWSCNLTVMVDLPRQRVLTNVCAFPTGRGGAWRLGSGVWRSAAWSLAALGGGSRRQRTAWIRGGRLRGGFLRRGTRASAARR